MLYTNTDNCFRFFSKCACKNQKNINTFIMFLNLYHKKGNIKTVESKRRSLESKSMKSQEMFLSMKDSIKDCKPGKALFKNIGGLSDHIRILKEIVMFPLLYHNVYNGTFMKSPKGILLYGPPGTGKTMIAGALANECSVIDQKVTFFSRKGADCLNKYVGESENTLRALFHKAEEMKPSIIFFDEIDGLAPKRSSHHDLVHASVVSTLLSLMDGLDCKPGVIVIGATNRIEDIDPALRRPGRFDKELHFTLPSYKGRREILSLIVGQWYHRPSADFVDSLAGDCIGYSGADLQALCTDAALNAVRRVYPQIYNCKRKIKINLKSIKVEERDFLQAYSTLIPSTLRVSTCYARRLPPVIEPLLRNTLEHILNKIERSFHHPFLTPNNYSNCNSVYIPLTCPCVLLLGTPEQGHTQYVAPAILHQYEHMPVSKLDITTLFSRCLTSPEERCIQTFNSCHQTCPCILYTPNIMDWWHLVDEATRKIFLTLLCEMNGKDSVFLLATANCTYQQLPQQLQSLFMEPRGQIVVMANPTENEREDFFSPLFYSKTVVTCCRSPTQTCVYKDDLDRYSYLTRAQRRKQGSSILSCSHHTYKKNSGKVPKIRKIKNAKNLYSAKGMKTLKSKNCTEKVGRHEFSAKIEGNQHGDHLNTSQLQNVIDLYGISIKQEIRSCHQYSDCDHTCVSNADNVSCAEEKRNDIQKLLTYLVQLTESYPVQKLGSVYENINTFLFSYRNISNNKQILQDLTIFVTRMFSSSTK